METPITFATKETQLPFSWKQYIWWEDLFFFKEVSLETVNIINIIMIAIKNFCLYFLHETNLYKIVFKHGVRTQDVPCIYFSLFVLVTSRLRENKS